MLDIKLLREQPEEIKKKIAAKGADPSLVDQVLALDNDRRKIIQELELSQRELNRISKDIAKLHGQQKIEAVNQASQYSGKIKKLKPELDKINEEYTG
jgi:seryl-tRNA synthetase